MSTRDPSVSPRKWSYVFCALPDRRTLNSSRCNDRFHDPSRCPICLRWIAPTSVAARYSDVVVDDPPFDRRYSDTVNRRRIVADSPIPIRTAVVGAARCSIVDPSSGQGSGGHDDHPRARLAIVAGMWSRLAARLIGSVVVVVVPLVRRIRCLSTRISPDGLDGLRGAVDSDAVAAVAVAAPACRRGSSDS